MMSVTPSSSKPPDPRWDYDVYLSFIGDETSYDFMYYLFGGLERNGVVTFRERPPGGENIPTLMLKAIQRSRIFIVVLSQGYVCSEYCLNELVEIVHHRNIIDHIFFPILYQLGPSDVQKRIETLEEAFPRSEEQFGTGVDQYDQRMQGWRAALTEVMNSSDQILHDDANGSMGILKSVEEVLDAVCTRLNIPRNTLRMDSCVEMMTDFLHLETSEIYIVGMSCMDEILKETLIGVVYSQIYHGFERTSLILDITEISKEPNGLVHLQEQLLGDIVGMNQVNINNADEGIRLIKEAIQGKRVLIVLDDVDELKQLHTLIGNSKCFGPGSRVIAVSRENQLRAELEAHGIYDVEDLPEWKSPQLFIWRASMMAHPAKYFSGKKDHYLQGKFFGHEKEFLSEAEDFWDEDDHNLQPIKLLSAGEGSEKQITLEPDEEVVFDMTLYYMPASQTLNLSGTRIRSLPKSIFGLVGLKRLILSDSHLRVLPLEVGELEQLEVLDLEGTWIRNLPENLRCPMLLELYLHRNQKLRTIPPSFFDYMPALQILNLSHTNIRSLPKSIVKLVSLKRLILSYCEDFMELQPEVGELEQLEILDLKGTKIRDLPENLRCPLLLELYLECNNELSTIPPSFFNYMCALQTLNLSHTNIRSLPKSIVRLVSLKRLIIRNCHHFMELQPEVGKLEQLEVLDLEGSRIGHLPPSSFDYMHALQTLNLSKTNISSLPESIVKLVSLKGLILSNCPDFMELPPEVGELKQLQVLDLQGTRIRSLPKSIVKLVSLKRLILSHSFVVEFQPEVGKLEQLEVLDLEATGITDLPPSSFDYMHALQTLNLSHTGISALPKSIVGLVSLKRLILSDCRRLMELPPEVGELKQLEVLDLERTAITDLPPSSFDYMHALQTLNLSHTGISALPKSIFRLVSLKRLILSDCRHLMELPPEVGELKQLEVLDLKETRIRDLPKNLRCPMLLELYLHNNNRLRTIPPSFFNYMPALQILNLSKTRIRSLPESIVRLLVSLKRLIISYRLLSIGGDLKQLEVLDLEGIEIMDLHESVIDLEGIEIMDLHESVIDLEGKEIMDLRENHRSILMFLHNNHKLKTISPSFFDYVPALQVLNLSRTGIRSLPESIFKLVKLKILILSYCHHFLRLSPKVGELKRLVVLDLEGTEIMDLPTEIKKLTKLTCLNLSFYGYMDNGSGVMESDAVFPRGVIKALFRLEELMISVNPDDKWWNECVEDIVTEVLNLKKLKTLVFYFPRVELVRHFVLDRYWWENFLPSHFRFIVGHHVKRIMSRRPRGVELELERWERCLEYINGDQAIPEDIKTLLQYSTAFFLERHATVKKLSDFGIENMKQLKCCVVGECNEVKVIIDETDGHEEDSAPEEDDEADAREEDAYYEEDDEADAREEDAYYEEDDEVEASSGIVLGSLEYLCIYYMKNLRSIWEGPVQTKCLSLLKFLTLRTCPELTTIFTTGLLDNLCNLEDLTFDDCPSIKTLVSCEVSAEHKTSHFLPNLKRMSLHYMPGLVSISSGLHIAPRLELLSFYDCPNLKNLLIEEVSSKDLKKIEGERSWWEALEWSTDRPAYLDDIFVPINIEDC